MHGMRLTPDVIPFVSTAYHLVASRNANTQLPNGVLIDLLKREV